MLAIVRRVAGSSVSNVRPSAASGRSPPITNRCGPDANARAMSERASGSVAVLMPLMLRKAELDAPQGVQLETHHVAGLRLVRRREHAGDDALAGPELLAGGLEASGHGLDHLLQRARAHRVLLLAVHKDAPGARVGGLHARPEGHGAVKDVAGQDLLQLD